jgi:hypothetical protein
MTATRSTSPWSNRARCRLWVAVLGAGGCNFDVSSIPTRAPARTDSRDGAVDAASGAQDAGQPDGTAPQDDAGSVVSTPEPVRHASCAQAELDSPEPPEIALDATGRPLFDLYRDVSCAATADVVLCTSDDECTPPERCLMPEGSPRGVCQDPREQGIFVLTLADGRCQTEAALHAHARACCEELAGFDCRAWPYAHTSQPGELCAVNADCEPGLRCDNYYGYDFGLCVCPNDEAFYAASC